MRYLPGHKAEIHRKIVKDASRRLRAKGLAGSRVAKVMHDVGLTHGGFYKHFGSKNDLLRESLHDAFQEMSARLSQVGENAKPGTAWKAIVETYLSPAHCDHAEHGCPLAALAPELARTDKALKTQILRELTSYKKSILPFMPGRLPADKERAFFALYATMLGAVQIARMLPEPKMRQNVLAAARDSLLRSF